MNQFLQPTTLLLMLIPLTLIADEITLKAYESWWEDHFESKINTFEQWYGNINTPSRIIMREQVTARQYQSILDIPCSIATDYKGLQASSIDIAYHGIDISSRMIEYCSNHNVPNVSQASIEAIPLKDSSIDLAYSRHLVEHIRDYKKAFSELVRVAKKEVMIVFFINPSNNPEIIDLSTYENGLLFHNHYNRSAIESYIHSLKNVSSIEWEEIGDETILHIYLTYSESNNV